MLVTPAGVPTLFTKKTGVTPNFESVKGGTEFVLVDAAAATKKLAFDHDKLATAINSATGGHYTGLELPFAPTPGGRGGGGRGPTPPTTSPLTFIENERAIEFGVSGSLWKCTLADYVCTKNGAIPPLPAGGRGGPQVASANDDLLAAPFLEGGDPVDGLE